MKNADGMHKALDRQQRITSFARYVNMSWPFAVEIDGEEDHPRRGMRDHLLAENIPTGDPGTCSSRD